ncbi:MAG: hypothetical protein SPG48_08570 [Treponema sp.]|nr:hypothetical protein [Treponema sp.]
MVLEAITLVVIGAAYVTGDADRKQKMRKICSEFVDVAKTTASDTVAFTKKTIQKIKAKKTDKSFEHTK